MPVFGKAINPSVLAKVADQATPPVIRAYHGSPYDFDKFDASKIGTGEGHQAFGYGHYFAQSPDVSESYRHALKDKVVLEPPRWLVDEHAEAWRVARQLSDDQTVPLDKRVDALVRARGLDDKLEAAKKNPGHMYEVEIGLPEDSLLDFDAPISQQPRALEFFQRQSVKLPQEPPVRLLDRAIEMDGSGQWLYDRLQDALSENAGTWRMPERQGSLISKQLAARALQEGGFPGIRYLDNWSRHNWGLPPEKQTRNYVIFPGAEDSIRILRKYGLLGPAVAGAMQQDDSP